MFYGKRVYASLFRVFSALAGKALLSALFAKNTHTLSKP